MSETHHLKSDDEEFRMMAVAIRSIIHSSRTTSAIKVLSMRTATATATTSRHLDGTKERRRPLVVLAGWLGCQPKSLHRYRQLYQQQRQEEDGLHVDFDVLLCIAPPSAVVQSVFTSASTTTSSHAFIPPIGWPLHQQQGQRQQSLEDGTTQHPHVLSAPCMEALAWQVLAYIDQSNCSACIFHVFSNGGCFVWEKVRAILDNGNGSSSSSAAAKNDDLPPTSPTITGTPITEGKEALQSSTSISSAIVHEERLSSIRKRLRGVVFDSCPGTHLYRIMEALQYCTWKERLNVILQTRSINHLLLDYHPKLRELVNRREAEYRQRLQDDPWQNVLQLYLYAENGDALIDYQSLDALVEHRRQWLGKNVVWKRTWKDSRHCAHLLQHPNEYKATIHSFVEACLVAAQQGDGSSSSSIKAMVAKL